MMSELLCGAAGALCVLAAFLAGNMFGARRGGERQVTAARSPAQPDGTSDDGIHAEQGAFSVLMGYDAAAAYGLRELAGREEERHA